MLIRTLLGRYKHLTDPRGYPTYSRLRPHTRQRTDDTEHRMVIGQIRTGIFRRSWGGTPRGISM